MSVPAAGAMSATSLRRVALAALCVAVAAILAAGLLGRGSQAGASGLWVEASSAGCGLTDAISCRIDVSHGLVDGAVSYTVRVTGPDGAAREFGAQAPGTATVWVPYAGSGSYRVEVVAWAPDSSAVARSRPPG